MENECIPLTESGFRRWIIRNFCELKEHVVAQCKETKNFEKKVWQNPNENRQLREEYKWIAGAEKLYKNFAKHTQVSIAKSTKQKKGY